VGYEYLSGNDPSSSTNGGFDPLWGRWPQWSELMLYNYSKETRIGEWTNQERLNFGWGCNPSKKIELSADYDALFAPANTFAGKPGFSSDGHFRGHYGQLFFKYKFNDHVNGHLWGEFFVPGSYYTSAKQDPATFLRAEMIFKW
jgi:hypothetical protein